MDFSALLAAAELTTLGVLAAWAAIFIAALVQSTTGQAFGSLAAPMVALFAPERIPAAMLMLGVIVTAIAARRDWRGIVWAEVTPALAGRATGAMIAAVALSMVTPGAWIGAAVGGFVLFGVALSLFAPALPIRRDTLAGAGLLSGLMATLTTVGAPPLALLYQHRKAAESRPTLNAFFMLGMVASLLAVASQGLIARADFAFAALAVPALLCGYVASRPALRLIGGRSLRPVVLGLSVFAALAAIIKSLI